MIRVIGFALYGPQAASHRVRLSQYKTGLAAHGIDLQVHSLLGDEYIQRRFSGSRPSIRYLACAYAKRLVSLYESNSFDLAIVYAELFPLIPAWLEQKLLSIPYILDIDDAFYLKYRSGGLSWTSPCLASKFDRLLAKASAVTVGNHHLASYARQFNPAVFFLPSVVDTSHYKPVTSPQEPAQFTIGWIGSPSTAPYLESLVDVFQRLSAFCAFRLLVVGGKAPTLKSVEVHEVDWTLQSEVRLINHFSVGVMPLPDTPWAKGKCAYKLIQCLSCGIPVVASPVGANLSVVTPECGFLPTNDDQWLDSLLALCKDSGRAYSMGLAGRKTIQQHFSLDAALPLLAGIIKAAKSASTLSLRSS